VSERERLLRAALLELSESGYAEFDVARAAERAGVGPEVAAEFSDADACLDAAYDQLTAELVAATTAGCESEQDWPERVRGSLEALVQRLAGEPEMAKVLTRSFPGIRPATYGRYVELLDRFVPYMHEGRKYSEVGDELPGEVELLAVGAAEAIIFNEVENGRTASLPTMVPEILFSVLVPFMGPDQAAEQMRSAAASA
jgi:AcrR family transcriptional regulator